MDSERYQLVPTGKKLGTIPTDTNCYDNDYLFKDLSDLVNNSFKSWYMKMFYILGKDRVLILASQARADARTSPQRLFSHLLKQETEKVK